MVLATGGRKETWKLSVAAGGRSSQVAESVLIPSDSRKALIGSLRRSVLSIIPRQPTETIVSALPLPLLNFQENKDGFPKCVLRAEHRYGDGVFTNPPAFTHFPSTDEAVAVSAVIKRLAKNQTLVRCSKFFFFLWDALIRSCNGNVVPTRCRRCKPKTCCQTILDSSDDLQTDAMQDD